MNYPYPFPIDPPVVETDYVGFNITALDNPRIKGLRCNSSELPNLELQFLDAEGGTGHIRFRVDLKDRAYGDTKKMWPFSFDDKVNSFVKHVAEQNGFTMPHVNSTLGKGNRTALNNLKRALYDPWSNQMNCLDAVGAVRILRTRLPTTKLTAWNYNEKAPEYLRDKPVYGLQGHFRLGQQIGFFVIDSLVGCLVDNILHEPVPAINDCHRLLEEHRMHILRCWPFATDLGLEMELNDLQCKTLLELNDYAGYKFYHNAVANGDMGKVIDRNPTVRPGWGGAPEERWKNMTLHAIIKHFMHDGIEVPRFMAIVARAKLPFTIVMDVDVMKGGSVGIFLHGDQDPLMTLHKPSRPQENNNV